jgi:hypothetical protein
VLGEADGINGTGALSGQASVLEPDTPHPEEVHDETVVAPVRQCWLVCLGVRVGPAVTERPGVGSALRTGGTQAPSAANRAQGSRSCAPSSGLPMCMNT